MFRDAWSGLLRAPEETEKHPPPGPGSRRPKHPYGARKGPSPATPGRLFRRVSSGATGRTLSDAALARIECAGRRTETCGTPRQHGGGLRAGRSPGSGNAVGAWGCARRSRPTGLLAAGQHLPAGPDPRARGLCSRCHLHHLLGAHLCFRTGRQQHRCRQADLVHKYMERGPEARTPTCWTRSTRPLCPRRARLGPLGEPPEGRHARQAEARRQLTPGAARGGQGDGGRHLAVPSPTVPSTLWANRCRQHHLPEQRHRSSGDVRERPAPGRGVHLPRWCDGRGPPRQAR